MQFTNLEFKMGIKKDWNRIVKLRLALIKILEMIVWIAEKVKKIIK